MGIKYNWIYPTYDESFIKEIESYNISKNVAKILNARSITDLSTVKKFFSDEYEEGYDPFLMYDMQKAVDRINEAIENEEKILVYGDYDADGITSTVLLVETLISLGANVSSYIPNRFDEGYGPNKEAFTKIIESGITLIITVDNGITAYEASELLQQHNVPVIITDHHLPASKELPGDLQTDPWIDEQAGTHLCGAAVAWKTCLLIEHMLEELTSIEYNVCNKYIPYVGIGLITDVMPPHIENRAIVKMALDKMNNKEVPVMNMFSEVFDIKDFTSKTIAWSIGPKLNSASRLGNTELATDVFFLQNPEHKDELEDKIIDIARMDNERKKITDKAIKEALEHKFSQIKEM